MPTEVSVGSINTIALKIAVQFDKLCNSGKPMLWQSYGVEFSKVSQKEGVPHRSWASSHSSSNFVVEVLNMYRLK